MKKSFLEQWLFDNAPALYDWLTNGGRAMNRFECTGEDLFWLVLLGLGAGVVVIVYLDIGYQAFSEWRRHETRNKLTYGYLFKTLVFVFCSITGYLSLIVGIFVPVYKIQTILVFILVLSVIPMDIYMRMTGFHKRLLELGVGDDN